MIQQNPRPDDRPLPPRGVDPAKRPLVDRYDTLLQQVRLGMGGSATDLGVVGVSACGPREGVSTVAVNLGVRAAHAGLRVLLIDAHLGAPALARLLSTPRTPGLTEALLGANEYSASVHRTATPNLFVLPAGEDRDCPLDGLGDLLDSLKPGFPLILVDLPPLNDYSAGLAMVGVVDGVLLVVEAERTSGAAAHRVKLQLEQMRTRVLGVVLNKTPEDPLREAWRGIFARRRGSPK